MFFLTSSLSFTAHISFLFFFFVQALPLTARLALAFRETKQWIEWQVARNARSDVQGEPLGDEIALRLRSDSVNKKHVFLFF
jgi:hypothetical protein